MATPAEWALSKTTFSKINSNSLWFAEQSEFFNGRFHTLLGLRYDSIQINPLYVRSPRRF